MTEKPDPFNVAAFDGSLNDSATRVSTTCISYRIFALYVLIALWGMVPAHARDVRVSGLWALAYDPIEAPG